MRRALLVLVAVLGLATARVGAAQSVLQDVQVQSRAEGTTVHITLTGRARYLAELMDRPVRIVIDLEDTAYAWRPSPLVIGGAEVKEIRGSQFRKDVARLVIELARPSAYRIEPYAKGLRVIIAGMPGATARPEPPPPGPTPAPGAVPPPQAEPPRAETPKPTAPRATRIEPGPVTVTPPGGGWRVQGIVVGEKQAVAYIEDPSTRRVEAYRVGQSLAGGTIESITEDRVVVRRPGGPFELRVGEPGKSAPPARN